MDVTQKIAGICSPESYDGARELIRENGKWMQYVNRLLDELHPNVLKMTALIWVISPHPWYKDNSRKQRKISVQHSLDDPAGSHFGLQSALHRLLGGGIRQPAEPDV